MKYPADVNELIRFLSPARGGFIFMHCIPFRYYGLSSLTPQYRLCNTLVISYLILKLIKTIVHVLRRYNFYHVIEQRGYDVIMMY